MSKILLLSTPKQLITVKQEIKSMDNFGVPKKINRHVLKALYQMDEIGYNRPNVNDICDAVQITMRNNVPVRDLHGVVAQSLQNMAYWGVIERSGSNYSVRSMNLPAPVNGKSSSNDTKTSKSNERDSNSGSGNSNSKRSNRHTSEFSDNAESPRKRRRLSRGSLERLTLKKADVGEASKQSLDTVKKEQQEIEKTSSSLRNLTKIQIHSQTSVKSETTKSIKAKLSNVSRDKSKESSATRHNIMSEHDSAKKKINHNSDGTSPYKSEDLVASTSSRFQIKADERRK